MLKQRILVHKFDVNETTDIFLPTSINIPRNAKKIIGFVFTSSIADEGSPLIGSVKITSSAFGKADIPDFDIFGSVEKKFNKDFLPVQLPIKIANQILRVFYEPAGNAISSTYTIRVYIKYLEEKDNGC